MTDRSNPLHPNYGKAVDPVILAADLTAMGYDVLYIDVNKTRLHHAQILRVNAKDMSYVNVRGETRHAIVIAVNPLDFHKVNQIEYKALASKQTIVFNM